MKQSCTYESVRGRRVNQRPYRDKSSLRKANSVYLRGLNQSFRPPEQL